MIENNDVVGEDEVIGEDTANDQEALAFEGDVEEPIVEGNEDIYAAIASENAGAAETVIDGSDVKTYEFTYTGEKFDLTSLFSSECANVYFVKNGHAASTYGAWNDTNTLPDGDDCKTAK